MEFFLFALGLLLWTLVEYLFHRFILHRRTNTYLVHDRAHHQKPTHRPTEIPFLLAGIKLLIVCGYWEWWAGIGFAAGVLAYVVIHYLSHRSLVPNALLYHHQYHHLISANKCFGVSSPLWDYIFGTHYSRKETLTSQQKAFYKGKYQVNE